MAALDQQQPGDILHKGFVAQMLVSFVHIGKASHLQGTEPAEPCTARAYGIIAHCVLQSIWFNPDSTATGFYTKTGMAALKIDNLQLPNEGWSLSWDGSGNMVPCMFGIRVLEKVQMAQSAVMAPLNEEDQEDLEAGLEREMVDEEIREYAAVKAAIKQQVEVDESINDEFLKIEMDLEMFSADAQAAVVEATCEKPAQEQKVPTVPPQVEPAQQIPAQQPAPQVAGKKRPREDVNEPQGDEQTKKGKHTPMPPPLQAAGVKRSRQDEKPLDVASKKPRIALAVQVPEKLTLARIVSQPDNLSPGPDFAAVASVEQRNPDKSAASGKENPSFKGKGKARAKLLQLPTPAESTTPEPSTPLVPRAATGAPHLPTLAPRMPPPAVARSTVPPSAAAEPFIAPTTNPLSPLDFKATALYHNTTLSTLHVPELRDLLKEWGYKPPKESTILSRMNKPELMRVVEEALKARDEKSRWKGGRN
ncbi:hypothetical protein PRZ48_010303 [Zasmidium cellare]|uniref:Uncharacterized protein n=1 Tax=Zasmidium cellare TaxID=395010 RepID=A0ABR0E8U3_ZASCE|nr:hypothetical protein PRZ48_010303 [Zasmidium cellare]